MQSEIIMYGLYSKCVKLSRVSKTIFMLDLALNYIDKLNVFLQINCSLLSLIYLCSVR